MKTKTINIPRFEDCVFTVGCFEEHATIRGNVGAINNEETDTKTEDHIIKQLESGNPWAWCTVRVTCYYDAGLTGIYGTDYLGCCSYADEKDFIDGGYFEDMKHQAYANFLANIEAL